MLGLSHGLEVIIFGLGLAAQGLGLCIQDLRLGLELETQALLRDM